MASLMVSVVIPAVILNSFLGRYSAEKARVLIVCTLATILVLLLSVAVGWKLFGRGIDCFAATFSNPGFFGLPLYTEQTKKSAAQVKGGGFFCQINRFR